MQKWPTLRPSLCIVSGWDDTYDTRSTDCLDDDREEYNPLKDKYFVGEVMIDNKIYLQKQLVPNTDEFIFSYPEDKLVPAIMYEPDVINGYNGDNLIIGVIANFHNELGVMYSWYKDEQLMCNGNNQCLIKVLEIGTYVAQVLYGEESFRSEPVKVGLEDVGSEPKENKTQATAKETTQSSSGPGVPKLPIGPENERQSDTLTETASSLVHEIDFESLNVNFKDILGTGAYGTVYRGKWVGTEVAVKVIKRAISYKNVVLKEAHLHATLRHPNIVTLMGVSFHKKDIAFVTELVNGNSLQYYIDEEITLPEETLSKVVAGIVKGVAYLHEVMVVHGDVKPANILVSQEMHAKICDFGIGKLRQKLSVTASVTVNGSLHGTITFLPDFKSDIWSLGITLVEFFTLGVAWEDVFSDQSEK
ncbi:hypothetical protein QZH41_015868, partial [Actinostola sp. cb2023]